MFGGLLFALHNRAQAVGAANATTLACYWEKYQEMDNEEKSGQARYCRLAPVYDKTGMKVILNIESTGIRKELLSALQQLGGIRKYGRAPPGALEREMQKFLESLVTEG